MYLPAYAATSSTFLYRHTTSSVFELSLRRDLTSFAEAFIGRQVSVVSGQHLDEKSPPGKRFDLRTEITQGFPFKTFHASVVGELMAELICRQEPKKGLITDLDDTLWAGILGEVGVEGDPLAALSSMLKFTGFTSSSWPPLRAPES